MSRNNKTIAYGFATFLLMAFVVATMPNASAAQLSPQLQETTTAAKKTLLMPETGTREITFSTTVEIPPTSGCATSIKVSWQKTFSKSYATVALSPTTHTFTWRDDKSGAEVPYASPQGGTYNVPGALTVTITSTREAPAFVADEYKFKAKAEPLGTQQQGCDFQMGESIEQTVLVKNDFLGLLKVSPQTFLIKSGQNSKVTFPIKIENRGNGPAKVTVSAEQISKNKLDMVIPPGRVLLDSPLRSGSKPDDTIFITAQTPHNNGYTNSFYSIEVKFKTEFDGQIPTESIAVPDEQSYILSVQVQGVYAPGVDPVAVISVLGVALVGFRRMAGT